MELKARLGPADLAVVRMVVEWLKKELGAVSANVRLPSALAVVVFPNGNVEAA